MIVSSGMLVTSTSAARQDEVRAGHHDQAEGDAERVVLDPAGLDLAQAATRLEGRPAERVDRAVDDLAVEPPRSPPRSARRSR